MGSVVCAQQMKLPPVRVETSMRIVDSLAAGTSFFMAELKRLKEIVDQAKEYADLGSQTLLFLLDEILQGTNSAERQIAVSRVVDSLISHGAIGAISTHDLDLATTTELKDACVPIHFTEQFETVGGKRRMTFDYQARSGIAPTTNALKLLEMVGLSEETN
jgi:DNA mismatch repair ATPase MutS